MVLSLLASPTNAITCEDTNYLGASYTIDDVSTKEELQLILPEGLGDLLGSFLAVEDYTCQRPAFGMNDGIYHKYRNPVGYFIESGIHETQVISADGPNNFGLLPNGIILLRKPLESMKLLSALISKLTAPTPSNLDQCL